MTEHTPGPWTAHDVDGTGILPCVLSDKVNPGGNFYVAQCNRYQDARLIAAAPALLEVLEDALEGLRNIAANHLIKHDCFNWNASSDRECPCSLCWGKRVIAAARGETPNA
jgi:hypothetical protein